MITDWSVEAAADSPVIEVPWAGWVDLRSGPITGLAELAAFPELGTALRIANGAHTFTSKVDMFSLALEEVDPEVSEMSAAEDAQFGLGSYLDCVLRRGQSAPAGFAFFERVAQTTAHTLICPMPVSGGLEIVVRPARVFGADTFGWTLYSYAFAESPEAVRTLWRQTMARAAWTFALAVASGSKQ